MSHRPVDRSPAILTPPRVALDAPVPSRARSAWKSPALPVMPFLALALAPLAVVVQPLGDGQGLDRRLTGQRGVLDAPEHDLGGVVVSGAADGDGVFLGDVA